MSWNGRTVLAVIPARGGSKGIPRKNLRSVGGLSLIGWAARTAASLPWIDATVLSTDDAEIAAEGERCGVAVPFMRPDELSTDEANSVGMWRHAWVESEEHFGQRFDCSVLLQPTTPIRRADHVERAVRAVVDDGHKAATTVSRVPGHFAPQKCLVLDERGCVAPSLAGQEVASTRQELPPYYWRNGACYVVTRPTLVDEGHIVEDDCAAVVVDDFMVNIDDPIELELCEFVLSRGEIDHE